jgi:hypothetical protein
VIGCDADAENEIIARKNEVDACMVETMVERNDGGASCTVITF